MKNKEFDSVQTIRSIRDKNYEETKELTRKELLERYKKRGKEAMKKLRSSSKNSEVTDWFNIAFVKDSSFYEWSN